METLNRQRQALEILQVSLEKSVLESLFIKVGVLRACNFIKEDSETGVYCDIYKLFKNNYFEEHRESLLVNII